MSLCSWVISLAVESRVELSMSGLYEELNQSLLPGLHDL